MNITPGQFIPIAYLESFTSPPDVAPSLLCTKHGRWDFEDYISRVMSIKPLILIPPFFPNDSHRTSMAAERVKARMARLEPRIHIGCVLVGQNDEQLAMSSWAANSRFAPIVLPPHPRWSRSRQAHYFHARRGIHRTWYHLPGGVTETDLLSTYPWVYSTGDELEVFYDEA